MASYHPPTENLPIFDPSVFNAGDEPLTIANASLYFLKYPSAQGTEDLQAINVNGVAQFNTNVGIGSVGTANLTPTINTYKSQVNLGNGGNGTINLQCPMTVGGFGSLQFTSSTLNMNSNSRINQTTLTTPNTLSFTNVSTSSGASNVPSLAVIDTSATQGLDILPNATATAFNPSVAVNDVALVGVGASAGTKNLTLTAWSGTNNAVKLTPTSAFIGAGSSTTTATTSTLYDGTNITLTSPNPPLSTATQPATSDNSNKMPTTSWVQSLFATLPTPTSIMPYLWFNTNNLTGNPNAGTFNLNCSATATNQYFTIRYFFDTQYTFTAGTAFAYQNQYCGTMDIYPFRIPTTPTSAGICQITGSINGNTNFSMTDATFAPNGRWYYCYQSQNQTTPSASPNPIPVPYSNIYLTSTAGTGITFNLCEPSPSSTCIYKISGTIEIVNKGVSAITFSSSGLSTNTNLSNYYATF